MRPAPRSLGPRCVVLALCALAALASCDGGDGSGSDHGTGSLRIETLAGGGLNLGDGGPATATFVNPTNVAVDTEGDVLIVDANQAFGHWIVRRVDARSGTIATVGGPCDPYVQADPPAHSCDLLSYSAIAVRGTREIFIATHGLQLFRADAVTGTLEHLAGKAGFPCKDVAGAPPRETCLGFAAGVALDDAGNVYLGEPETGLIRRLDATFQELTVVASGLHPDDIAVDRGGHLFVADWQHHRIDRVDLASGATTTIAGGTDGCAGARGDDGPAALACFVNPTGVAVRSDGTLFAADADRIRRIDGASGLITTAATVTSPSHVDHLAFAPGGALVFTENAARRVSRLDVEHGTITLVAGNGTFTACGDGGPGTDACLGTPYGAAPAPDGSVYFADGDNQRLGRVDANGQVTTVVDHDSAGSCGDTGPRLDFCLADPSAVVRDRDGTLYFADRGTEEEGDDDTRPGRVRRFDPATGVVTTIAGNCTTRGSTAALEECIIQPSALVLDGHGGLYVGSQVGVHRIDLGEGTIRHVVGGRRLAENCLADGIEAVDACIAGWDLALDAAGNLYIADQDGQRVRRVDASGLLDTVAGKGPSVDCPGDGVPATSACLLPNAIAIGGGRLFIASAGTIRTVDLASGIITTPAGFPADCGSVAPIPDGCVYPWDITLGDDGRLVVAEPPSRSVRRITLP